VWSNKYLTCVHPKKCPAPPKPTECPNKSMVWNQCGGCKRTCEVPEPVCIDMCRAGCECPVATVWSNKDRMCVHPKKCPEPKPEPIECRSGMEWNKCAMCKRTCEEPTPICTRECRARCACPEGTVWSNKYLTCVHPKKCPAPPKPEPTECPNKSMVWNQCGGCKRTCEVPNPVCIAMCRPGCECPKGTVWNNMALMCVHPEKCSAPKVPAKPDSRVYVAGPEPPRPSPTPQCSGGMAWSSCAQCNRTCGNPEGICTRQCQARCECPKGTVWSNEYSKCVHPKWCPGKCRNGMEWRDCTGCKRTCENPNPICTMQCRTGGCECPKDTVWSSQYGKCVKVEDCSRKCYGGMEWSKCAGCKRTCLNPNPAVCALRYCRVGCQCPGGTVWSSVYKKCVEATDCPAVKCKDPGMVWNKCAGCKKTCENPNPSCFSAQLRVFMALPKPAMCEPRCECRQGTVWSNTYRKCVIQSDCPNKCVHMPGTVWNECASCERTCENPVQMCFRGCRRRCACPPGQIWSAKKWRCLTIAEC